MTIKDIFLPLVGEPDATRPGYDATTGLMRRPAAAGRFDQNGTLDNVEPPAAVAAFNDAFGRIARDMIAWTVQTL